MIGPAIGAAIGAVFFLWIAGVPIVSPTRIAWVMQSDWKFQFMGWHFFRREPWQWPPGVIESYHTPPGSSVGYTDSIPLVAFVLKPFEAWLPMPMQYLGLWLLICVALQGLFGALIARVWTRSVGLQALTAGMFMLAPTLLNRSVHPALCAHWLLLWAIWLYCRREVDRVTWTQMVALGIVSGLVHPYLAVMVLALLAAVVCRAAPGRAGHWRNAAMAWAGSAVAVAAGWWASGLFELAADDLVREGLTAFSMNLLSPVTPMGWSRFVPALPAASPERAFEGFQYLGVGAFVLIAAAVFACIRSRSATPWMRWLPLIVCCSALAVYALGPRIMFGHAEVLDYSPVWIDRLAVFRVTGRFFWPATYAMLALATGCVVRRLPARVAWAVLLGAVILQVIDLGPGHATIRAAARSPSYTVWAGALSSTLWAQVLPHYRHMVAVLPGRCGALPAAEEALAFLAGTHGLTFNGGEQARWSHTIGAAYCSDLRDRVARGHVDDRELYVVFPGYLPQVRSSAPSLVCGEIDGVPVCVTSRSYQRWREVASLQ